MLRAIYTARVGGAGARRPLPGSSSRTSMMGAVRQQSTREAAAAEADAAARAARVPGRRSGMPLAGPRTLPAKRVGLYDPALEKDSCGVGLAVQMKSIASRQVRFGRFAHELCTNIMVKSTDEGVQILNI